MEVYSKNAIAVEFYHEKLKVRRAITIQWTRLLNS